MSGDHRTAGGVMPVFTLIAIGIDVAGIEAAHIALVTHLGELLAEIIGRQHLGRRAGHSSGIKGGDMTSLGIGGFARGAECRGGGEDKTCAQRQGEQATAQCGKHRGSFST